MAHDDNSNLDEKRMVGLNELGKLNLNAKLAKQVAKRSNLPPPTDEKLEAHLAVVTAPTGMEVEALASLDGAVSSIFFDTWDKYYPRMVSLLGWASWIFPSSVLVPIKSLLAVLNNDIMPILRKLLG